MLNILYKIYIYMNPNQETTGMYSIHTHKEQFKARYWFLRVSFGANKNLIYFQPKSGITSPGLKLAKDNYILDTFTEREKSVLICRFKTRLGSQDFTMYMARYQNWMTNRPTTFLLGNKKAKGLKKKPWVTLTRGDGCECLQKEAVSSQALGL